jgi:type IV pilus assembly protein PilC
MTIPYTYVAKDQSGKVIRSSLRATSQTAALANLRTQGLAVMDIAAEEPAADAPRAKAMTAATHPKPGWRLGKPGRVPLGELAMFSRQLAIAVDSGMPLREALESIAEDLEHPALAAAVKGVVSDLHGGQSFSAALAQRKGAFGSLFAELMRAAEESGSLSRTLQQLSLYLERSDQLEKKIKRSASYPLFVAVFFCIVCVVMTTFVLPQFQQIFDGFDARLPALSRVVFATNQLVLHAAPWIGLGLVLGVSAFVYWRRTPRGRWRVDQIKLQFPLLGNWLRKFAMARFCRNMAMMLRGGVPVTTAMEITSSIGDNQVLKESLLAARERLISGMSISESLGQDPQFPRLVVRMVAMGEESGRLPEVLEKVADVYEDQVEGSVSVAMSLMEPAVICVFGVVVLLLILAIYLPVFTIGSNVQ